VSLSLALRTARIKVRISILRLEFSGNRAAWALRQAGHEMSFAGAHRTGWLPASPRANSCRASLRVGQREEFGGCAESLSDCLDGGAANGKTEPVAA
jgi:hypothetical protein